MFSKQNSSFFTHDSFEFNNLVGSLDREKVQWESISRLLNIESVLPRESEHNGPKVAVLLGFYNGNAYLREQIDSILGQTYSNVEIFILDDCSETSVDIESLEIKPSDSHRVHITVRSKNFGFCQNFLNGLYNLGQNFEYFAFSDQDDIWFPSKIQDALDFLQSIRSEKSALYCARTTATDEAGVADLGVSPFFPKHPAFANALVQSIAGGNTMVMNRSARDLIVGASMNCLPVSHDWWCYQVVTGAGGIVYHDKKPCLRYRQHDRNIVGTNNSWPSQYARLSGVLKGRFRKFNDINLDSLSKNRKYLTPENERKLDNFIKARQKGVIKRIVLFKRAGIYRQTLLGNLGLIFGLFINKV